MATFTVKQIAEIIGAKIIGDENAEIAALAQLTEAKENELSFLSDKRYAKSLQFSQAAAVILREQFAESCPAISLVVDDPYQAFAKVSRLFATEPAPVAGIHPTAIIAKTAVIGANVSIAPYAVIGENVVIGNSVVIGSGASIGANCTIGDNSKLYANVTLYHQVEVGKRCVIHSGAVIGADGFGFAPVGETWEKIEQIGGVVIEDDVDIGANSTVDRGAIKDTILRQGVKIDNLCQVGHNCDIGENSVMAGCAGVAGSTKVGKHVLIGGASAVSGHIEVADVAQLMGGSMVIGDVKDSGAYSSAVPAMPVKEWRKTMVLLRRLDEMSAKLKALEKKVDSSDSA
jgi:UDP-3-O-[3-hydroxymyristoyl] glucosamine N-acyltransferase